MTPRSIGTAVLAAVLLGLVSAASVAAQPPASPKPGTPASSTPFSTPNTDSCPNKTSPPKAIDLSEVPAPGEPTPTPLPVSDKPIGGHDLAACGVVTPDGSPPPGDISATAWQVSDLDTGQVLAAKDPHGRYRPASTIKVLLAIVALRNLDLDTVVVGTTEDADVDGTRVGIGPGGHYTNRQLMQALLMASGNDAAHAIAAQLGGEKAAVAKMNEVATSLGAADTRAATPSGLDGPGMSTSAYDLSLIFREAMTIPTFAELIHTEQVEFPGFPGDPRIPHDGAEPRDHPAFPIGNDNQLLYNYAGALGGKTGYTDDARQTYVAGAERDGRRLAVSLLAADVVPIRPWEQAARLLDYGFALDEHQSVGVLVSPAALTGGIATAPGWIDRATLAAPPPDAQPRAVPTDGGSNNNNLVRTAFVLGGSVVVLLLVIGAARLSRRR